MPPGDCRYSTKRVRLQQVRLRQQDKQRRQQYRDFVVYRFRNVLRKTGTHLAVWLERSEDDRCLQFADVVVNFVYEGLTLRDKREKLKQHLRAATDGEKKQKLRKQLNQIRDKLNKWEETRKLLEPHLRFILTKRLYSRLIYRIPKSYE